MQRNVYAITDIAGAKWNTKEGQQLMGRHPLPITKTVQRFTLEKWKRPVDMEPGSLQE